jgi:hypothetical protein
VPKWCFIAFGRQVCSDCAGDDRGQFFFIGAVPAMGNMRGLWAAGLPPQVDDGVEAN